MRFIVAGIFFFLSAMALAEPIVDVSIEFGQRVHRNWEGEYVYLQSKVLKIDGQKDIYVVIYRSPNTEGNLCDFAILGEKGIIFLLEAVGNRKGVTPVLESIDVFPGEKRAEIIVRWRHPGNGESRSIQKFSYDSAHLTLIDEADFLGRDLGMKWVKAKSD